MLLGQLDWGDVPTWVAATFTGFAVWGAYRLLRAQQWELHVMEEERRGSEEDRRRRQASMVAAWCVEVNGPKDTGDISEQTTWKPHSVLVHYRNGSDEPVFSAGVTVKSHWGARPNDVQTQRVGIVPPQSDGDIRLTLILPPSRINTPNPFPPVEIDFTDAQGRNWMRSDQGELIEVPGDKPPRGTHAGMDQH